MRRSRWAWGVLALLLPACWWFGQRVAPTGILLITMDTTRADRLGCYGYAAGWTPHLDALAAEGVVFENCRTVAPLTLPTHATLLTGLLPPEHGLRLNGQGHLPEGMGTVAEHLRARGFATAAFVGAVVLDSRYGLDRGFEVYDDDIADADGYGAPPARSADAVADAAIRWLDQVARRPFFCWVHLFDPHFPYERHPGIAPRTLPSAYDEEVAFMDANIGRLLDALRVRGRLQRTVVVAVADHGEGLGERGETTHGMLLYENTIRVPLILACPGRAWPPRRVKASVSIANLPATLLDFGGVPPEAGDVPPWRRSLRLWAEGGTLADVPCYVEAEKPFAEYRWAQLRALGMGAWKYIRTPMPELYDTTRDRDEQNNLAAAEGLRFERMDAELQGIERSLRPARRHSVALSAAERRRLESLGYAAAESAWGGAAAVGNSMLPAVREMLPLYNRSMELKDALARGRPSPELLPEADRLVSGSPATPVFRDMRAVLLAREGRFVEAAEEHERSIALAPENVHAWVGLALALLRPSGPTIADPDLLARADDCIRRVDALEPDGAGAALCHGFRALGSGQGGPALAQGRLALQRGPGSSLPRLLMGDALRLMGDEVGAAREYRAALSPAVTSGDRYLADQLRERLKQSGS